MQNDTLHINSTNLAAPAEVEALAHAFSDLLCVALNKCGHAITEVIELNAKETELGICHSHDFLDANAVMADAFQKVVGRQTDLLSSRDLQLWSGAWELAKLRGFNRNQNDESGKGSEFVSYQIAPVRLLPEGSVEFCSSLSEALSYTEGVLQYAVYGRNPDGTVDWIADCDSAEKAAEYLSGILGRAVVAQDDRAEYSRLDNMGQSLARNRFGNVRTWRS